MHDHNLDDLIIDNIEPKNSKVKSFLTIIALLIVVLIVAIVLTKILLKTPSNNDLIFEQNTAELIAPELKLQETAKPTETKKEPVLSSIVESKAKPTTLEMEKPEIIKEPAVIVKKEPTLSNIIEQEIKAPVVETKKPAIVEEPSSAIKEAKDAADKAYWESVQEKRKAEEKAKEEKTEKLVKETVPAIKPVEPKKVEIPEIKKPKPVVKPVEKVVVQKPAQIPVAAKPTPKSVSTKKYYVQVGSFKKQPSARFISVIKNNGFTYRIIRSSADGTKKLLIGPYEDRASVNRVLGQVKDRINKRAFVVKR
ncbi:MAG: SPOR domain-containing protein [Sulfurovum sp.]|uniref:SPOR domain-containing protein n=1 Tax=Sulfurovum sp. TaxID=1969726 RepID=UPI003C71E745